MKRSANVVGVIAGYAKRRATDLRYFGVSPSCVSFCSALSRIALRRASGSVVSDGSSSSARFAVLAGKIFLAVSQVRVGQTVIHVRRVGIGGNIELQNCNRAFFIAGLKVLVSQDVDQVFREERGLGIVLAGLFELLRHLRRASRQVDFFEDLDLFWNLRRLLRSGRPSGSLDKRCYIPVHDQSRQLRMHVKYVGPVSARRVMDQGLAGIVGDTVKPLNRNDGGWKLVIVGDGEEDRSSGGLRR